MKKTALVTGASRGIGKGIAQALAEAGYDLILICRNNLEAMESMAKSFKEKYGSNVGCFAGDVSDPAFVAMVFGNISELDVLINNAGVAFFGLLSDMSVEEWHEVMGINLDSVFYFCKEAIHLMLAKHSGNIINITSVWGERGSSMEVCYSASKGGINALTKALAKELAPSSIKVNAIACGMIDTDMNSHLDKEDVDKIIQDIPADRMGTPEEVGQMVLSLLSAPDYMTGQIVTMDGGWT